MVPKPFPDVERVIDAIPIERRAQMDRRYHLLDVDDVVAIVAAAEDREVAAIARPVEHPLEGAETFRLDERRGAEDRTQRPLAHGSRHRRSARDLP